MQTIQEIRFIIENDIFKFDPNDNTKHYELRRLSARLRKNLEDKQAISLFNQSISLLERCYLIEINKIETELQKQFNEDKNNYDQLAKNIENEINEIKGRGDVSEERIRNLTEKLKRLQELNNRLKKLKKQHEDIGKLSKNQKVANDFEFQNNAEFISEDEPNQPDPFVCDFQTQPENYHPFNKYANLSNQVVEYISKDSIPMLESFVEYQRAIIESSKPNWFVRAFKAIIRWETPTDKFLKDYTKEIDLKELQIWREKQALAQSMFDRINRYLISEELPKNIYDTYIEHIRLYGNFKIAKIDFSQKDKLLSVIKQRKELCKQDKPGFFAALFSSSAREKRRGCEMYAAYLTLLEQEISQQSLGQNGDGANIASLKIVDDRLYSRKFIDEYNKAQKNNNGIEISYVKEKLPCKRVLKSILSSNKIKKYFVEDYLQFRRVHQLEPLNLTDRALQDGLTDTDNELIIDIINGKRDAGERSLCHQFIKELIQKINMDDSENNHSGIEPQKKEKYINEKELLIRLSNFLDDTPLTFLERLQKRFASCYGDYGYLMDLILEHGITLKDKNNSDDTIKVTNRYIDAEIKNLEIDREDIAARLGKNNNLIINEDEKQVIRTTEVDKYPLNLYLKVAYQNAEQRIKALQLLKTIVNGEQLELLSDEQKELISFLLSNNLLRSKNILNSTGVNHVVYHYTTYHLRQLLNRNTKPVEEAANRASKYINLITIDGNQYDFSNKYEGIITRAEAYFDELFKLENGSEKVLFDYPDTAIYDYDDTLPNNKVVREKIGNQFNVPTIKIGSSVLDLTLQEVERQYRRVALSDAKIQTLASRLDNYVEVFNGKNSTYGRAIAIIGNDEKIKLWLEKRLRYLFSKADVNLEKNDFALLKNVKVKNNQAIQEVINSIIAEHINNKNFPWSQRTQDLIEKYANNFNKQTYRIKRVRELLKIGIELKDSNTLPEAATKYLDFIRNNKLAGESAFDEQAQKKLNDVFTEHLKYELNTSGKLWSKTAEIYFTEFANPLNLQTLRINKIKDLLHENYLKPEKLHETVEYLDYIAKHDGIYALENGVREKGIESVVSELEVYLDSIMTYYANDTKASNGVRKWDINAEKIFTAIVLEENQTLLQSLRFKRVDELLTEGNPFESSEYINIVKKSNRPTVIYGYQSIAIDETGQKALDKIFLQHQEHREWNTNAEMLIATWGTSERLDSYRLKRIEELLEEDKLLDTEEHINYLEEQCNVKQGKLVATDVGQKKLDALLLKYSQKEWSMNTEILIEYYGSKQLLNAYRRKRLQELMENKGVKLGQYDISVKAKRPRFICVEAERYQPKGKEHTTFTWEQITNLFGDTVKDLQEVNSIFIKYAKLSNEIKTSRGEFASMLCHNLFTLQLSIEGAAENENVDNNKGGETYQKWQAQLRVEYTNKVIGQSIKHFKTYINSADAVSFDKALEMYEETSTKYNSHKRSVVTLLLTDSPKYKQFGFDKQKLNALSGQNILTLLENIEIQIKNSGEKVDENLLVIKKQLKENHEILKGFKQTVKERYTGYVAYLKNYGSELDGFDKTIQSIAASQDIVKLKELMEELLKFNCTEYTSSIIKQQLKLLDYYISSSDGYALKLGDNNVLSKVPEIAAFMRLLSPDNENTYLPVLKEYVEAVSKAADFENFKNSAQKAIENMIQFQWNRLLKRINAGINNLETELFKESLVKLTTIDSQSNKEFIKNTFKTILTVLEKQLIVNDKNYFSSLLDTLSDEQADQLHKIVLEIQITEANKSNKEFVYNLFTKLIGLLANMHHRQLKKDFAAMDSIEQYRHCLQNISNKVELNELKFFVLPLSIHDEKKYITETMDELEKTLVANFSKDDTLPGIAEDINFIKTNVNRINDSYKKLVTELTDITVGRKTFYQLDFDVIHTLSKGLDSIRKQELFRKLEEAQKANAENIKLNNALANVFSLLLNGSNDQLRKIYESYQTYISTYLSQYGKFNKYLQDISISKPVGKDFIDTLEYLAAEASQLDKIKLANEAKDIDLRFSPLLTSIIISRLEGKSIPQDRCEVKLAIYNYYHALLEKIENFLSPKSNLIFVEIKSNELDFLKRNGFDDLLLEQMEQIIKSKIPAILQKKDGWKFGYGLIERLGTVEQKNKALADEGNAIIFNLVERYKLNLANKFSESSFLTENELERLKKIIAKLENVNEFKQVNLHNNFFAKTNIEEFLKALRQRFLTQSNPDLFGLHKALNLIMTFGTPSDKEKIIKLCLEPLAKECIESFKQTAFSRSTNTNIELLNKHLPANHTGRQLLDAEISKIKRLPVNSVDDKKGSFDILIEFIDINKSTIRTYHTDVTSKLMKLVSFLAQHYINIKLHGTAEQLREIDQRIKLFVDSYIQIKSIRPIQDKSSIPCGSQFAYELIKKIATSVDVNKTKEVTDKFDQDYGMLNTPEKVAMNSSENGSKDKSTQESPLKSSGLFGLGKFFGRSPAKKEVQQTENKLDMSNDLIDEDLFKSTDSFGSFDSKYNSINSISSITKPTK